MEKNDEVKKQISPPTVEKTETLEPLSVELSFPQVKVEELDHSQEFFKEQHTTSFSYLPRKNWTSFTASKDGLLTKILLYGKANLLESPHYGLSMSGFVRANKPDSGPKYGKWSLSRDEIVSQLALQGLAPRQNGWLTIRIRGEVPQKKGTKYFLVCDQITENKSWFGEFAFAEENPYELGTHWLNPKHDLVMRTYVGKTEEQLKLLQIADEDVKAITPASDLLPEPIAQNARQMPGPSEITNSFPQATNTKEYSDKQTLPTSQEEGNQSGNKSMFDRLFRKKK